MQLVKNVREMLSYVSGGTFNLTTSLPHNYFLRTFYLLTNSITFILSQTDSRHTRHSELGMTRTRLPHPPSSAPPNPRFSAQNKICRPVIMHVKLVKNKSEYF